MNDSDKKGSLASLLPRATGGAIAVVTYVVAHRMGVVAPIPLWLYVVWTVLGTAVTIATQYAFDDPTSRAHLHLRLLPQCVSITGIAYLTGWGPALAFIYLKAHIDNLRIFGRRAAVTAALWSLAGMTAGQLGIDLGLLPSLISLPEAHGLAVLTAVGIAFVSGLLYVNTSRIESAETELRRSESRLREAQSIARLGSWSWDVEGDRLEMSRTMADILDAEGQPGNPHRDLDWFLERIHSEDRRELRQALDACVADARPFQLEHRIVRSDDEVRWLETRGQALVEMNGGKVVSIHGTGLDITDRQQLEDQLLEAMKMRAVGQLAGGLAHDLNNVLTVVRGVVDLAEPELDEDDPLREELATIRDASEQASDLIRQLLAFGRKQVMRPDDVDLNGLVEETVQLLDKLLPENIDVETDLEPDLGIVRADPGQVRQVVMNLAINARDAMPDGGTLTIETGEAQLDEAYAGVRPEVVPGSYVYLAVSDTGVGMAEATQERIFEPYFTTKEAGKGSGLGLATTYGIVKQSGGHIGVYSEVGVGTTFKVYLPRTGAEETTAVEAKRTAELEAGDSRGAETVLIAEDNPELVDVYCRALERRGYTAISARSGEEAIRRASAQEGSIDLLVTDVVMPEMSGVELARRLAERHPDMKVLFVSGYTENVVVRRGVLKPDVDFLHKPFGPDVLVQRVRAALDDRETD